MDKLEKIDLIRERLNVSYEKAHKLLDDSDGDVIKALIKLEENNDSQKTEYRVKGQELLNKIKNIIQEGNVNKITVKNNDQTLVQIPVTAGIIGLVLFPYMGIIAGLTAMYKDYTLEIERKKEMASL